MKVGLISIHSAHNYGSVLQAYALQEVLKKYSDSVEIIDYRPEYFEMLYKLFSLRVYNKFPGLLNKLIHCAWRILKISNRMEKIQKFESFMKRNYTTTNQRFKTYQQLENTLFNYDAVFVGSDQVWNTDITEGFDHSFYLDFLPNTVVKASYAASIARSELDIKYIYDYKRSLSNFNFISIREKTGKELLSKITNKDIEVSIDPTLLLDKAEWDKISFQSKIKPGYNYIFTYILQDNPEITKIIHKVSSELGLPIVSIGKKKRFKNETVYSNAGPEDFLNLIKGSSFVITNSFHGTVFSIIYEKPNYIVPHSNTGSRMVDLLKYLGLENRVARSASDLRDKDLTQQINYLPVRKKICSEQLKSEDYIKRVLKNE